MSKSLRETAKDYIMEVADSMAIISKMSDAKEGLDAKKLYNAITDFENSVRKASSKARSDIINSEADARKEIFS